MTGRLSHRLALLLVATLCVSPGCDGTTDPAAPPAGNPAAPTQAVAEAGHFTGRVTLADGSPITVPGVKFKININGVTAAGERNTFEPQVGPDGTFKLKLPQGMFYPPFGTITFPFEGKNYTVALDPVDPVKATRDGAAGIVQHFVWRLTGPKPAAPNPDVNNAEHWFGISVRDRTHPYREDTKQSVTPPPGGSKITWTFKPISKLFDGSPAKPLTVERTWSDRRTPPSDALNDLPPANYEVSGVITLPDGTTKRLLLLAGADAGPYAPTAKVVLEPNPTWEGVWVPSISWVVE